MAMKSIRTKRTKGKRKPAAKELDASAAAVKRSKPKKPAAGRAAPLTAEPGPDGRRLLAIIEQRRRLWANPPDEAKHPRAFARHENRSWALGKQAGPIMDRIARRRVRTLSDVIDRAISIGWQLNGFTPANSDPYDAINGILGVAGLSWDRDLDADQ